MEIAGVTVKLAEAYDPKKTLIHALYVAGYAVAGVLVADQVGLTSYLYKLVPPEYTAIGQVLIAAAFAALRHWLANRNR